MCVLLSSCWFVPLKLILFLQLQKQSGRSRMLVWPSDFSTDHKLKRAKPRPTMMTSHHRPLQSSMNRLTPSGRRVDDAQKIKEPDKYKADIPNIWSFRLLKSENLWFVSLEHNFQLLVCDNKQFKHKRDLRRKKLLFLHIYFLLSRSTPAVLDISGFTMIPETPRRPPTVSLQVLKRPPLEGEFISVTDSSGRRVYLRQKDDNGTKVKLLRSSSTFWASPRRKHWFIVNLRFTVYPGSRLQNDTKFLWFTGAAGCSYRCHERTRGWTGESPDCYVCIIYQYVICSSCNVQIFDTIEVIIYFKFQINNFSFFLTW